MLTRKSLKCNEMNDLAEDAGESHSLRQINAQGIDLGESNIGSSGATNNEFDKQCVAPSKSSAREGLGDE